MNAGRAHRRHALRVAGVATLIVMAGYLAAAVILNLIVTDRLLQRADSRLMDGISDAHAHGPTLSAPEDEATDVDDAPLFVWAIDRQGVVTPLTPGAPPLPERRWNGAPVTLTVGTSSFRFDSVRTNEGTIVAGQSLAGTTNVQSTLLVAELVFGAILAIAVFGGALVVGLRASAPSELVRRKQAEFTADASHELRTPISVIDAEVGLALDRPRDTEAYREVLERIRQESRRLRRIVEDLLWLARADNEPVRHAESDVVDVAEVAERCVQRFTALAAANSVELSLRHTGQAPFTIFAPAELLDRLSGVLLENACKFAGQHGQVEVTVGSAAGRVLLRVDDSGPGIPLEEREAVLDRFHRVNPGVPGTGLGLAIADSVVRATDGSWEIGLAELGGARFEVSWRRVAPRRGRRNQSIENLSHSVR